MNLFTPEGTEDYITIQCFYYIYKTDDDREVLLLYKKADDPPIEIKDKVKVLKGKFRIPDFFTHNEIVKESIVYRPEDNTSFNSFVAYKENILKRLLKEVEIESQTQKITETNFGQLQPSVAEFLYEGFSSAYLNPQIDLEEFARKEASKIKETAEAKEVKEIKETKEIKEVKEVKEVKKEE